jgi:hypothetical protein
MEKSNYLAPYLTCPVEQEVRVMTTLIDADAPRVAKTTRRRAVLRLLALAAGSFGVALSHAETQARGKNKHHEGLNDEVGEGFTADKVDSARERFGAGWQLWDDMINVTGD